MNVQEFILNEMERQYPGQCCRMVDNWIRERAGFSALRRYGRNFRTEDEVQEWISEFGGIAVAVNRVMRACGFRRTTEPQEGDIGLVFYGGLLYMAIHAGSVWVARNESGMVGAPLACGWKAWRIPPCLD